MCLLVWQWSAKHCNIHHCLGAIQAELGESPFINEGSKDLADDVVRFKQAAAYKAVEFVESGMVVGLGAGSTAEWALRRLGERIRAGDLHDVVGIAAAKKVEDEARQLGIPLTTLAEHPHIDLTIDGADEVDPQLDLIKGGGGALLREKIVAQNSQREIIVVDESKLVAQLGETWALPVEVVTFGWEAQADYLRSLGAGVTRRPANGQPMHTDQGHYILDCQFGPIADAYALDVRIKARAGIVDHGLFLGLATDVIVAGPGGVRHIRRP
jgi:ribose 5-phosphate isomerase A